MIYFISLHSCADLGAKGGGDVMWSRPPLEVSNFMNSLNRVKNSRTSLPLAKKKKKIIPRPRVKFLDPRMTILQIILYVQCIFFYPTETKILCLLKWSVHACRLLKNMNPFLCLLLNRLYYDNVKYFVMYSSINVSDFISHDSNKLFWKLRTMNCS